MHTEPVTTLERKATELLDELKRSREPILITRHGRGEHAEVGERAHRKADRLVAIALRVVEHRVGMVEEEQVFALHVEHSDLAAADLDEPACSGRKVRIMPAACSASCSASGPAEKASPSSPN